MPLGLHETVETVAHRGEILDPLNKLLGSFTLNGLQVDHKASKQSKGQVDDGGKGNSGCF